jgi:uncharacterized protein DUF5670
MLELVIVVLLVLWLLGYFGPARIPAIPKSGNVIHLLLVIILILIIVRLVL